MSFSHALSLSLGGGYSATFTVFGFGLPFQEVKPPRAYGLDEGSILQAREFT